MRLIISIIIIALSTSCASTKSFRGPSGENIFESSCNGGWRTLADCYRIASEKCPQGYEVFNNSSSNSIVGLNGSIYPVTKRTLMYSCK